MSMTHKEFMRRRKAKMAKTLIKQPKIGQEKIRTEILDMYPYNIDGERVEFFHWHMEKKFRYYGTMPHIDDGMTHASHVLRIEGLFVILNELLDQMNDESDNRREDRNEWPNGFTIAICGDTGAVAFCSENDQFSKKRGRQIAMSRLKKGEGKFVFYIEEYEVEEEE